MQAPPPRPASPVIRRFSEMSSLASNHSNSNEDGGGPMGRRRSIASTASSAVSSICGKGHMSEDEQEERRRKIKDIMKDTTLSAKEKSRNIQALMDGRQNRRGSETSRASYYDSDNTDGASAAMIDASAANNNLSVFHYSNSRDEISVASSFTSWNEGDDAQTDQPRQSAATAAPPQGGSYRQYHGRSYSLQDWKDTDRVMAAANTTVLSHNPVQASRLMEQSRPPCEHYQRKCTVVSPCCGLAFGCRICHDDCPVLPPPLSSKQCHPETEEEAHPTASHKNKLERRRSMPVDLGGDEDDHHLIDRFAIKEVICRECFSRQSSKTNNCNTCGVQFGEYHCNVCNLWMSDKDLPYHCVDCGFCRIGGRGNFRHCDDCGMCIDAALFDDHNCKSGKYMSNCPICQEDLFSSRFASHEMPCGHAIHWHCFKELTTYDTRCPICKKTADTPEQMAPTWSAIAMGIAFQPVPPEMARLVNIFCNDCEQTESNLRWHFLGVRCQQCFSFNTAVEQIVMQGRDAAAYMDQLEAQHAAEAGFGVPANISMPTALQTLRTMSHAALSTSDSMDEDLPSTALETSADSSDLMDDTL